MKQSLFEQGKVHIDRGEVDQAILCLTDHLNGNFWDADALFMLSGCLLSKGKDGLAAGLLKLALSIKPKFPEALLNLGGCFRNVHKNDQAEAVWNMALELETIPLERAKIYSNIAGCYINNGTPEKAIEFLNKALDIAPEFTSAKFNRGLAYLEMGDWRRGWEGYEAGFESGDRTRRTYKKLPVWDGSKGKKVIVWGEQGVGDEIMFASVIPDLIKDSAKVIFDCHPRLVKLFERSFPGLEIHGTRKTLSNIDWVETTDADCSVCISSLPKFYRNAQNAFPGRPFLKADPDAVQKWRALGNRKMRVGLAWAGGTSKTRSDLRSIPLLDFAPVLKTLNADFYSLQYTEDAAREVCELGEKTGIVVQHYPGAVEARDYDETANFVASMDLVITVCTAIVHLSGGLGIPTWVLAPSKPAWRYAKAGMPWYSSVTLYRQGTSWAETLDHVAGDLAHFGILQAAE